MLDKFEQMQKFSTILLLAALTVAAPAAYGQAGPPLGDDFIFFVNGTNTMVPTFDGAVVEDPAMAGNSVIQYEYGNWSFQAFRFDAATGVDMSANRDSGDVLHLRLWVDPANAGMEKVALMMEDKTDGSGADDGSADLPFRLVWRVPEDMRNGEWHDLEIPLPPATWQELEDGKAAETLDDLAEHWVYAGAWSSGGFGVGVSDEAGPNTTENPTLWQEFEWSNVQNIGFFWDNNTGGGPVRVDDVYIGAPGLDLSIATNPPSAMSGVMFEAITGGNRISWMHNPEYSAYNVYASTNEFTASTDLRSDPDILLVASVPHTADSFAVVHRVEVLHPSLAEQPLYYAVTSLSVFGVENTDISGSSGMVNNPELPVQAYITELTDSEAEMLFTDLSANNASGEGFPDWLMPFVVDSTHSKQADAGLPDNDEDLSAKVWAGYSTDNELFIYAEVTDDVITLAPSAVPPSDAWQHDSIEFGWGNYDVRDAGGTIFAGSPHQDMERGDFADYQFRISGHGDGTKAGTTPYAFVGWSIDAVPQGGGAVYDVLETNGMVTGWRVLALFPLDAIQNTDQGDAVVPPPTGTDFRVIPFNIALNDGDGANRDAQIQWSIKGNAGSQWWNTPAQWMSVAMSGRLTVTGVDDVEPLPESIALEQNYPNPFNPVTSIQFALPATEKVTLRVFDLLGRPVAILLDGQTLSAGAHTVRFDGRNLASGQYIYRLEAGGAYVESRRMTLIK
ncbi:MAG: T9SS type A sorting domain-containing protein [Bacteroidota bacterium]|nr:T9SS type A sorting domain-containing protein [Bacteroidota bacterium]